MGISSFGIGWIVGVILAWFGLGKRDQGFPLPVRTAIQAFDLGEEQRREKESLDEFRRTAPFRQSRTINVDPARGRVLGFRALRDGRVALVTGRADAYGAVTDAHDPATVDNRLVWTDAEGREERSVTLGFTPRGVTEAPDGTLWVVGGSTVARFAADGAKLAEAEAPHFTLSPEGREEFVEEMRARHAAELESHTKSIEQQEEMVAELEAKKEGDPGYQTAEVVDLYKRSAESMKRHLESRRQMTDEQVADEAIERVKQIHRVAVSEDAVFIVTNMETGYGFAVWRLSPDLSEPTRVVEGLAGCCGQMDVQVVEGGLAIAENSRHQVRLVDFDGEPIRQFGETSRSDVTKGFGGCCNPMNTCLDGDGCLLTSESNGLVKRYGLDGTYREVIGVADVQPGCKNSSIGMSADGRTLYYLDAIEGKVVVLDKEG